MRRVVVTGMGIVSSIGNNTQEVLASLREGRSGVIARRKIRRARLSLPGAGAPTLKAEEVVDRRAMRFLGGGAAWNHVAMEQAIRDSGLEANEISNDRTGLIMGSGGPSTRTIVEAADITRAKGPEAGRPVRRAQGDVLEPPRRRSSTWFKIKGVNYSISSACATSNHCIGNAYETDPMGQAGHHLRRRLRGSRLDAVGAVRRDGRDVDRLQRQADRRLPRL